MDIDLDGVAAAALAELRRRCCELQAERDQLRTERDALALGLAVHSGQRELWGLTYDEQLQVSAALSLAGDLARRDPS